MINQAIGTVLICIGIAFDFFGVLGLVRLPDVYNRLQAATKCVTFGTAGILLGVLFQQGFNNFGFKCIIGIVFIFLTSPVAAHAIARAAHRGGIKLTKESINDAYEQDKELKEEKITVEEIHTA